MDLGSNQNCIKENVEFAFPITGAYTIPTKIPIDTRWKPQLNQAESHEIGDSVITNLVIQNDDSIWFVAEKKVMRYKPQKRELLVLNNHLIPSEILIGNHGEIFGINSQDIDDPENNSYFLSQFKNEINEFVAFDQKDLTGYVKAYFYGNDGQIWFVSNDNQIFNFNPGNGITNRYHLAMVGYELKNLTVDKNDNIWLLAYNTKNQLQIGQLIRFNYHTNDLVFFSLPSDVHFGEYLGLYIDKSNRLWADDYGYLDNIYSENPIWYQIIRSPIFIHNRFSDNGQYQWSHASPYYETKDGLLWFYSSAGLANLDLKTKKWCLESTIVSKIVEDTNGNIWMVNNGQIYKKGKK